MLHEDQNRAAPDQGLALTKGVLRTCQQLKLTPQQLAKILDITEALALSITSGNAKIELGSEAYHRGALLVRAYRALDAVMAGDHTIARIWLVAVNTALDGRPIDLMYSKKGLTQVVNYLVARRGRDRI
jgi:hypothetical protein